MSSTVFFGMRIVCDILFFTLLWLLFQDWRVRGVFDRFSDDPRDARDVLAWLDRVTHILKG